MTCIRVWNVGSTPDMFLKNMDNIYYLNFCTNVCSAAKENSFQTKDVTKMFI